MRTIWHAVNVCLKINACLMGTVGARQMRRNSQQHAPVQRVLGHESEDSGVNVLIYSKIKLACMHAYTHSSLGLSLQE